ncbi:multi-pass transmembrane protein [Cryptosporidium ryanae]|uniref:multi-pass transmembrane protein n=1 Tax=Cryptosporidium ryanae TaxID=515981 RepID=UPI00351A0BA3|nr:multi-pass transmembrane protein [Cryptosporidium ryanae]
MENLNEFESSKSEKTLLGTANHCNRNNDNESSNNEKIETKEEKCNDVFEKKVTELFPAYMEDLTKTPLVFDEYESTTNLLMLLSFIFVAIGVIDIIISKSYLGVAAILTSLFVLFFRYGQRNRLHSSLLVLKIVTLMSIITWIYTSRVTNTDEFDVILIKKIWPLFILQFLLMFFLTLWLLLIFLSGYSSKSQQTFYIDEKEHRISSNMYFSSISVINLYTISTGFEFGIFLIFLVESSYIVAIIPFISILISYVYIATKSRKILQYTEILLPFVILSYVIMRTIFSWVAPDQYTSKLGALMVTNMAIKQVIGLSILFTPLVNYYDMLKNYSTSNIFMVISFRQFNDNVVKEEPEQSNNVLLNQDISSVTLEIKNDNASVISINSNNNKNVCEIELVDQPSHSIVIDDAPKPNIPYEDDESKISLKVTRS